MTRSIKRRLTTDEIREALDVLLELWDAGGRPSFYAPANLDSLIEKVRRERMAERKERL